MNTVCADLPFVTTNLDDLLVHLASKQDHARHLDILFHATGLAFQGSKHHVGLSQVPYLGHVFLSEGMQPDKQKLMLSKIGVPSALKSFQGLASFYRHYIPSFADIVAAKQFLIYTDASATRIGAVLEQSGHVIACVNFESIILSQKLE